MKFVATTTVDNKLFDEEEAFLFQTSINNNQTTFLKALNNLQLCSFILSQVLRKFQVIHKTQQQQYKNSKVHKNWKNQNFCIAAS